MAKVAALRVAGRTHGTRRGLVAGGHYVRRGTTSFSGTGQQRWNGSTSRPDAGADRRLPGVRFRPRMRAYRVGGGRR